MIDQSHNVEGKIDAMIQSVMNIQTAYAKALLVDERRLAAAQRPATCSARTGCWSTPTRPTCGRSSDGCAGSRRRRARPGGGVPRGRLRRAARRRARLGSVESAYERL